MSFLSKLLGVVSGNSGLKMSDQLLFDKVIGFRGVVPGVGTSTIVQNVAIALSEVTNFSICVLDTNFIYPTQYPMLVSSQDSKRKDYLDFEGDLTPVTLQTSYRNVSLLTMSKRTVVDMMSNKDNELTVEKLMGSLKSYFDIILVDLSYEFTNVNIQTAIKCNRIINIADQSLKSIYHLKKSLNTMATLAVPLAKADKVVLNKVIPDVLSNTSGVITESGLKLIGEIPLSKELAIHGVSGKRIWASATANKDIHAFSEVINSIIDIIVQATPLNQQYMDANAVELAKKQEKENKLEYGKQQEETPKLTEVKDTPIVEQQSSNEEDDFLEPEEIYEIIDEDK